MRLQEISSLFNMNPPLIQNHMAGFQDIYKFANLLWDINSVYLPRNRGTILKDQKSLLTKDKKPAIAAKISRLFLVSQTRELKIRCKKGGTFLTRTLIILPMLRLAGSATSFSLVAAFIPTTLLGGGSNRQPSCHRPSGLSLRNQTAKNHTFKMQQY